MAKDSLIRMSSFSFTFSEIKKPKEQTSEVHISFIPLVWIFFWETLILCECTNLTLRFFYPIAFFFFFKKQKTFLTVPLFMRVYGIRSISGYFKKVSLVAI